MLRRHDDLDTAMARIAAATPGVLCSFTMDANGIPSFPLASANVEEFYGFPAEELARDASRMFARIHPDDRVHVQHTIAESARTLTPWQDDFRYEHPKKGEVWIEGHSTPYVEADGRIVWYGFVHDVSTRKLAEGALRQSLIEKEALLQEIQHRVMNNLQLVMSLLTLQANRLSDNAATATLMSIRDRINSLALLHRVLYRSENLASVDMVQYLKELCRYQVRSNPGTSGGVDLETLVDPLRLPLEISVSCGLIIQELVANALRHAFPDGRTGKVVVSMDARGSEITLRVCDDGIGFPEGVVNASKGSLGLQLVEVLADQLKGHLTMERRHPGCGTLFQVVFPLPEDVCQGG